MRNVLIAAAAIMQTHEKCFVIQPVAFEIKVVKLRVLHQSVIRSFARLETMSKYRTSPMK